MQILVECRKNGILRFMLVRMEQIQLKEMYECEGRMSITNYIKYLQCLSKPGKYACAK